MNGEDLFREDRNYAHFLRLYAQHVAPVADTFAYCLMHNHFHLAIRVRETDSAPKDTYDDTWHLPPASQAFSNFFNAYAKAINKTFNRTGGLFENPYRRIHVQTEAYFKNLIAYIHLNPQKHGFVTDFRDWKWSSYAAVLSQQPTHLQRDELLNWFDGPAQFGLAHLNARPDTALMAQDFD